MVTEKTTLVVTLEGEDTKAFKSIINKLATRTVGFNGIHNHLDKAQVKLLDKLDKKLNPKKDEEN